MPARRPMPRSNDEVPRLGLSDCQQVYRQRLWGAKMSSTDIDSVMGREAKFVINIEHLQSKAPQTDR
jgi:hypothetical protein